MGDQTVLYSYRDCQNVHRFHNVEQIRNHLIRYGFKERYTRWYGMESFMILVLDL
jgi:Transposase-associated domain